MNGEYEAGCLIRFFDGQIINQRAIDDAYRRGLDEAWNAVHKIMAEEEEGGISSDDLRNIFGLITPRQIIMNYTARDVIDIINEYEEDHKKACPILDNYCPYPHLQCHECEVHCVMERAKKKLEERNGN